MAGRPGSLVVLALMTTGLAAGAARGDGLPVLGVDVGASGVLAASGGARYVTLPAGAGTVVARVRPSGGQVVGSRLLKGRFTVPAVAYDGSAAGLSADGRTLVLIEPRSSFPRANTTFAVIAAKTLRQRGLIRLRGDFSFDAISPRGSLLYLIQYISPQDPDRYLVRVYDLERQRLLPNAVVDPREASEQMRGKPLTRASSGNGRWAYTLYDGAGATPFLHALDTSSRSAYCIDLAVLKAADLSRIRLRVDPVAATVTVGRGRESLVVIDARTLEVKRE